HAFASLVATGTVQSLKSWPTFPRLVTTNAISPAESRDERESTIPSSAGLPSVTVTTVAAERGEAAPPPSAGPASSPRAHTARPAHTTPRIGPRAPPELRRNTATVAKAKPGERSVLPRLAQRTPTLVRRPVDVGSEVLDLLPVELIAEGRHHVDAV